MPSYEYKCDACGHEFEEFQGIKDAPLRKCPQCKKNKLRRLISGGAAIVFKGSGFYQTDYRSEKYKNSAKAESNDNSQSSVQTTQPPATATTPSATTVTSNTKNETQKNDPVKTKE
ncbi:MAG: zinc ribbon domain-containing protein [Planctomycetaceae bacterium]|jgi:putative FmdB family regulatory protein|nr:zinc ribbon domain-containing protein [Planctomycetaceae bacterium]